MTYLALIGLAVMWAAVLLPSRIADVRRSGGRGRSSIDTFQHQLHLLGRGATTRPATHLTVHQPDLGAHRSAPGALAGIGTGPSARPSVVARRRRDVLVGLAVAASLTLVAWVLTRSTPLLAVHLLADAALLGYVLMLARVSRVRREHSHKVRYLPARPAPALDAAWLPRTGS
jgi:hypothetical protein